MGCSWSSGPRPSPGSCSPGRGIAVCGTHGKTTTTSMISRVLVDGGYDPTFLVGGELNDLGSNARHGEGEFVVCEADESDGSLLLLSPEVAVLTNLELDHHSHYLHVEDVERVFRHFTSHLPRNGLFVYYAGDPRVAALASGVACRAVLLRTRRERCRLSGPRCGARGAWAAASRSGTESRKLALVTLRVPGRHNVLERPGVLRHAFRARSALRSASSPRSRASAEPCAVFSGKASVTGSPWSTTTPIIPPSCAPLWPPPGKGIGPGSSPCSSPTSTRGPSSCRPSSPKRCSRPMWPWSRMCTGPVRIRFPA